LDEEPFALASADLERADELDRDRPIEQRVMGEEHNAHRAGAERLDDAVFLDLAWRFPAHGRIVARSAAWRVAGAGKSHRAASRARQDSQGCPRSTARSVARPVHGLASSATAKSADHGDIGRLMRRTAQMDTMVQIPSIRSFRHSFVAAATVLAACGSG